jgi:hypothetical protein
MDSVRYLLEVGLPANLVYLPIIGDQVIPPSSYNWCQHSVRGCVWRPAGQQTSRSDGSTKFVHSEAVPVNASLML